MPRRPEANGKAGTLQGGRHSVRKLRLEVNQVAYGMQTRAIHGIAGANVFVEYARKHLNERAAQPSAAGGADRDR